MKRSGKHYSTERIPKRCAPFIAAAIAAGCGGNGIPQPSSGDTAATSGHVLYVSATAPAGGKGTIDQPFSTLAQVQQASADGDTIVVLASPNNEAPLDGGIALKPNQRLIGQSANAGATPRLTNTSSAVNSGDAVTLAPGVEVAGLTITGTYRGGIYGLDVPGVHIHDNDVSGHNTSCAQGIIIPPDTLPTNFPGLTFPNPLALPNGWAGIYVLADQGSGTVSIRDNVVHDSACGDGIDIGLSGTAVYTALIDGNTAYGLTQSGNPMAGILSILAVGLQTKNTSKLTATVSNNTQHDIGTANRSNVDPECVYPNVVDASMIIVSISNNLCDNSRGGWSANGLEIPMMNDGGTAIVNVVDSSFTNVTSDIIEPIALGTNQYLEVNLLRVTAAHANGQGASPLIDLAGQFSYGNEGDCLSMFSTDGGNTIKLTMRDSVLSDCYFNGLSIAANHRSSGAATKLVSFDIDNTQITANHGNGIRVFNGAALSELHGKVQNSNISGNATVANALSPRDDINIDNQGGAIPSVDLDFGGGSLGSPGGNCIVGAGVQNNGTAISMRNNWWGAPSGPAPGTIRGNGTTDASAPLQSAPLACQ